MDQHVDIDTALQLLGLKDRHAIYARLRDGRLTGYQAGPGNRWKISLASIEAHKNPNP